MKRYRSNVCVVLTDRQRGRVLVFRRVDQTFGEYRWQFPQGGLEPGETPEQGMVRELREEIGTGGVQVLAQGGAPIRYDYPPEILAALAANHSKMVGYDGQEQHWFLARLDGSEGGLGSIGDGDHAGSDDGSGGDDSGEDGTAAIHFDHQPPEFDAFRWVTPLEAVEAVVPFKRAAYAEALRQFGLLPPE